jgi:hypothetical protein
MSDKKSIADIDHGLDSDKFLYKWHDYLKRPQ